MPSPVLLRSAPPARATRVGALPRPRVRPLAEVLAELVRPAPTAPPAPVEAVPATPPSEDPQTRALVVRLLRAVVEVLDGTRPAAHLRRVCDDAAHAAVVALAPARPAPWAPRGVLRAVRVCPTAPRAVEAAAAVHRDGRARALAARLEHDGHGWRVTVLAVL